MMCKTFSHNIPIAFNKRLSSVSKALDKALVSLNCNKKRGLIQKNAVMFYKHHLSPCERYMRIKTSDKFENF